MDVFASMSYEEIANRCRENLGKAGQNSGAAAIDIKNAESEAGAKYHSACARTYEKAKKAANKYIDLLHSSASTIEAASQNSQCGAYRDPASQKTCFTNAIETVKKAKEAQEALQKQLKTSTAQVRHYMTLNRKALNAYIADQNKIGTAIEAANKKAKELSAQGNLGAANAVYTNTIQSSQVSSPGGAVIAQDGAASTISEYRNKIPSLVAEQDRAIKQAESFASYADTKVQQHQQQASKFASMEQQLTQAMNKLAPGEAAGKASGLSDSVKLPENGPVPMDRPLQETAKGSGGIGTTGGSSTTASASDTGHVPGSAPSTTQAAPSSAPMAGTPASPAMAAAAAPMGASSSGVANPASYSDPYAGMNNQAAYGPPLAQQEQYAQNMPSSSNFVGSTYDPRTNDSEKQEAADIDPEIKVEEANEQVVAAAGLSGSIDGGASGASSAPGILGADGKPIRTGFSSAGGGALQPGNRSLDRDVAGKEQFSPDLKSGAVSIAGSEMKSAIASLAEELGATDLDLDLGGLTEEEKTALAPLEGDNGVRSPASIMSGGRATAGLSRQGSDEAILDEQSMPLFARARSAHERALLRGNLILGSRKKL
jgi:hypothetical protein